jgi:hypothetical protein
LTMTVKTGEFPVGGNYDGGRTGEQNLAAPWNRALVLQPA